MSKMIDGNALIMSLTDWWYSSFGQEETEESKAIKTVVDEVEKYVDGYPTYREWIPVSYHEITEEEREEKGYPKDWVYLLDCEMPQDEQEILVQVKNGEIRWDVCYLEDGFSLDSGWDWADDVVAWMPLPDAYREDGEE